MELERILGLKRVIRMFNRDEEARKRIADLQLKVYMLETKMLTKIEQELNRANTAEQSNIRMKAEVEEVKTKAFEAIKEANEEAEEAIKEANGRLLSAQGLLARKDKAERQQAMMLEIAEALKVEGAVPADVLKSMASKYPDIAMDLVKKGLRL